MKTENKFTRNSFKINNFDLIRLLAALEVVCSHTLRYLKIVPPDSIIIQLLNLFPGVPIFFFISGFLISKSWESSPNLKKYTINRVLRIYPALVICTILAMISVACTGYFSANQIGISKVLPWFLAQISIIQFYNPGFMRSYGTGVLNGSLWTIAVELQFYLLTPLLYWLFKLKPNKGILTKLIFITLFFMIFHIIRYPFLQDFSTHIGYKLFGVSFLPWFYMFLVGVIFQKYFKPIHQLLKGRALPLLALYLPLALLSSTYLNFGIGSGLNPILYLLLASLIFAVAYTKPSLSKKIFNGNDISYGVYIYHIPIVNLFMFHNFYSSGIYLFSILALTIIFAYASWQLIEKPSLNLKKH